MCPPNELRGACAEVLNKPDGDLLVIQVARVLEEILRRWPDVTPTTFEPSEIVEVFRAYGLIPEKFTFVKQPETRNKGVDEEILAPGEGTDEETAATRKEEIIALNKEKNEEILALFRKVGQQISCGNMDAARICFAVCIYPQRAAKMQSTLKNRLEMYASFLGWYRKAGSPLEALKHNISKHDPEFAEEHSGELDELARDIADWDHFRSDPNQANEVLNGAAFYLATCHMALLQTIFQCWYADAEFVKVFRLYFGSPPSYYSETQKERVIKEIGRVFWGRAQNLEKRSRSIASLWPQIYSNEEFILRAWRGIAEKKVHSPFPYYTFRSQFATFWLQEFRYYDFGPFTKPLGDGGAPLVEVGGKPLSPDELRAYREGYRLVRTTFLSGSNERKKTEMTEMLRKALDAMWYEHLERRLLTGSSQWGGREEVFDRLTREFGKTEDYWNTLYTRLRMRMWAYSRARFERLTNEHIRRTERPRGYELDAKGGCPLAKKPCALAKKPCPLATKRCPLAEGPRPLPKERCLLLKEPCPTLNKLCPLVKRRCPLFRDPHPLAKESAVLTIASLAKAETMDTSLLGPFTAHVFLRPRLKARYNADRWDFKHYVQELWRWVTDESFECTIEYGKDQGSRAYEALYKAMGVGPLSSLMKNLQKLKTEQDVKDFVARNPLLAEEKAAQELAKSLIGTNAFYLGYPSGRGSGDQSSRVTERVAAHWVIPVWYLTVVEHAEAKHVIERLRVDENERQAVRQLVERLKQSSTNCVV